jgi:glycosyl hydrolase family 42 (putative beta-galactosidase)
MAASKLLHYVIASILLYAAAPAFADEIVAPELLTQGHAADFIYRFDQPATGTGSLRIEWTDAVGRVAGRQLVPFTLEGGNRDIRVTLDLRNAAALSNSLAIHMSFAGTNANGAPLALEKEVTRDFAVVPDDARWSDYQLIYWQRRRAPQYAALKAIGVNAAMLLPRRDDPANLPAEDIAPLLSNNLHWYVENIATDFYAPYHRFTPGQGKTAEFLKAQAQHQQTPSAPEPFMRQPSLVDPKWLADIRERLTATVRAQHAYSPLYYSLGDETGIADLAAAWDFDLSPQSLAGMRAWLRQRYPSLDALNTQWGTDFADWDAVMPDLTDAALKRSDDNFSAWSDFKEWMDESFARAVKAGTAAVHEADRTARSAIEGTQIPGWGGYDYTRLADAVDVMELYDYNDNVEIVRSLNPSSIVLKTVDLSSAGQVPLIWRSLLRGARGLILWDAKQAVVSADGTLGEVGKRAEPLLRELRGGLGALFINSERHIDPVAILYSPASFRVHWLIDRRKEGTDWSIRKAETEYGENAYRSAMESYARVLEHGGLQPRYVSEDMIAGLRQQGYKVVVLPHAIAMSRAAADSILAFMKSGGTVIADEQPAVFDEHGRRLPQSYLAEIFSSAANKNRAYRMDAQSGDLFPVLAEAGVRPEFTVTGENGESVRDVEIYRFASGNQTLLALLRDRNAAAGGKIVTLQMPRMSYAVDLRTGNAIGRSTRIPLALTAGELAIVSLSDAPPAPLNIGPVARLAPGTRATIRLGVPSGARQAQLYHIDVHDASGRLRDEYSKTLVANDGIATFTLPIALNDPSGPWRIEARALATGAKADARVDVGP